MQNTILPFFGSSHYLFLTLPVLFSPAALGLLPASPLPSSCPSLRLTVSWMRITVNEPTAKQLFTERFDHLLINLRTREEHGKCIECSHAC